MEKSEKNKGFGSFSREAQPGKYENARDESEAASTESKKKNEALAFLIESGRAGTPQEAERYLESLNQLKEKLIGFAQDLALKQIHEPNVFPEGGMVLYPSRRRATEEHLKDISIQRMDRSNPEVWHLETKVSSSFSRSLSYAKRLKVKMRFGSVEIEFDPYDNAVNELKRRLSDEELQVLQREFTFARRDLVAQLRQVADAADPDTNPRKFADENVLATYREKKEIE